ncbi:MAG TPA: ABC transporter ATP-binding protein [Steroidobacteraceae bacterium]|jgi:ABC-2 type transport system ATP-binding protein|nr:ABC transporter ATP-binding protein [Steroidobacteraceae bacterium]
MQLVAERLQKKFGAITAVAGVSFAATAGEVLGLLGPNGAGKSTTISMLAGLTKPDAGAVQIDGRPLGTGADPGKRHLGLVTQEIALLEDLPARMNLEFFGGLYGLSGRALAARIAAALELTSLSDRARDPPSEFSGGMRRRLNIACALLHEPQILLLDEPTVGVDPQSRNAIFETIEVLAGEGKTLVYTTHYMEEVERLCDRVVIIDHGKVLADDTLAGLLAGAPVANKLTLTYDLPPDGAALAEISGLPGVIQVDLAGTALSVSATDLGTAAPRVLERLAARGFSCQELTSRRANLEDVFLALTGHTLRDT